MKNFYTNSDGPIVETKAGKVRGFVWDDSYCFFGMEYAHAGRFEQPVDVECWEGVKPALNYSYIAYPWQPDNPNGDLLVPHRFWPKSENCQNLNVWTPSIDKNAKKAVIVWLHGGGMSDGSAIEMVAYDGKSLSEYGDVVVVTVNHRLNVFGFLDVSAYGEKYHNSKNAGVADLVMAMKWVHENIENFGGDPENVTVIGQSGGGKKVMSMMNTPAAAGYVQKAVIMSGTSARGYAETADIAKDIVEAAGGFDAVLALDSEDFLKLAHKVTADKGRIMWGPTQNDWFVGTLFDGETEVAKKIPLMVSSCIAEMTSFGYSLPGRQTMSREEKEAKVFEKFGEEKGKKLLEMFYKAYPDHDAIDAIVLDDSMRQSTLDLLDLRAEDGAAPTYSYLFAYDFPVDDGKAAWHCADIPFTFRNAHLVANANEPVVGEKIENELSNAWISFAKTGSPENEYLPDWKPYTKGNEVTMIIDRNSEPRVNYDKELLAYHRELQIEIARPNMLM